MHQVHNKEYDASYRGINHDGIKRFVKGCDRQNPMVGIQLKKIRNPQVIIIRNKYTKEIVDLEVGLSDTCIRKINTKYIICFLKKTYVVTLL